MCSVWVPVPGSVWEPLSLTSTTAAERASPVQSLAPRAQWCQFAGERVSGVHICSSSVTVIRNSRATVVAFRCDE